MNTSSTVTAISPVTAIRDRFLEWGRWSVLLCLFSVPINKPATNLFIFLALLFTVIAPRLRERLLAALRQPVVIGAMLWFLALFVGALHAPDGMQRWVALGAYKALFYPLIVATLLDTRQWRNRALFAFGLSVGLILLVSWIQFFTIVLRGGDFMHMTDAHSFTVFKDYTQQGVAFLVFAAMAASFAHTETDNTRKRYLWIAAGAAFINVAFLLQSRTAYLILVPLLLYWVWRVGRQRAGWRGIMVGLAILALAGSAALFTPRVQQRLAQAKQDVAAHADQRRATSMGTRLEFAKHSLPIIAAAPWLGHGLGQWEHQYRLQIQGLGLPIGFITGHPHQETLLILSEQGFIGFGVYLLMLILLVKYIRRLEPPQRDFYLCLVLIYITAGLANCILADFGHRHVFLMLLASIPLVPARAGATT